jgi:hypothetical protein
MQIIIPTRTGQIRGHARESTCTAGISAAGSRGIEGIKGPRLGCNEHGPNSLSDDDGDHDNSDQEGRCTVRLEEYSSAWH